MELNIDINDCAVQLSDGLASAQLVVPQDEAEGYLNKTVRINLEDGNRFTGIITAINDYGNTTGSAVLTARSIVNMAMDLQFYSVSTNFDYGVTSSLRAYKGSIFGDPDILTGKYEKTRINQYLKLLINNASEHAVNIWSEKIIYDSSGKNNSKLVDGFEWNGDTISNLFYNLLGSTFDITTQVNGNTIKVRNTDKTKVDRVIDEDDIQDLLIGTDLMASASKISIESPDINGQDITGVTLTAENKFYGLPHFITDVAGINQFDVGALGTPPDREVFNIPRNVYEYDTPHSSGEFNLTVDSRYTTVSSWKGEAYEKYRWKRPLAIIDENLGRAGATNTDNLTYTFDRTDEQAQIGDYYAKVMGDLEHQGSMSLPVDTYISVGDVCKLPDGKIIIIKSIKYGFSNGRKIVGFGNNEGNAYNEIKNRVRLPELIAKKQEIAGTPQPLYLVQKENGQPNAWLTWEQWRSVMSSPFNAPRWRIVQEGAQGKTARSTAIRNEHRKNPTVAPKREKRTPPPRNAKDEARHREEVQAYNRKKRAMGGGSGFIEEDWMKK